MKKYGWWKKLLAAVLFCVLAVTSCAGAALAEETTGPGAAAKDQKEQETEDPWDAEESEMVQTKVKSESTPSDKLSTEELAEVDRLNGTVAPYTEAPDMTELKDGITYVDISKEKLSNTDSVTLLQEILTTNLYTDNIRANYLEDVWIPAFKAALIGGGSDSIMPGGKDWADG